MKGHVTALASTALLCIASLVAGVMYIVTGYYLYFFLAVTSLFFGSNSLFFLILKGLDSWSKQPKPEVTEEKKKKKKIKIKINFCLIGKIMSIAAYVMTFYFSNTTIYTYAKNLQKTSVVIPTVANVVVLLILFVAMVVCERLCKHGNTEKPFVHALLQNSRIFLKILSIEVLLAIVVVIVESLELLNIQRYIAYIFAGVFYYSVLFLVISMAVIAIRKEFCVAPYLNIPIPMWKIKDSSDRIGFVEYLETNTGISMRSLWSVKYVKQIAPLVVLVSGFVLWISTCVVQIETYQQGAVYRLGVLQEEIMQPGIHFTLPYPFDKVEVYDTEVINKTTIGYRAEENADNIWTKAHGQEEYKLLLGGGDELVSINLRLEYKISDLKKYLKTATDPKVHMEALAYELVTDQTIETDLSSLLSVDREKFASNFKKELSDMLKEQNLGIEVVSVVLESIHPPVEIATVYQELISAEITAEKIVLYAEGTANATLAKAEASVDTVMYGAEEDYQEKVANAKASIAEFLASVEAYQSNPDAYTYYKYLAAVGKAYGNANLVILGDGVDESRIYFGSFGGGSSAKDSSGTTTEE